MTRRPLTLILADTVSHGAQEYSLYPRLYAFELESEYGEAESNSMAAQDATLSFLERVRLWLHLMFPIFGEADMGHYAVCALSQIGQNRSSQRRENYDRPLAYRTYALGHILLRRYSYTRFIQWLNTFTLLSRIERCFLPRRRFLDARERFAACLGAWGLAALLFCHSIARLASIFAKSSQHNAPKGIWRGAFAWAGVSSLIFITKFSLLVKL